MLYFYLVKQLNHQRCINLRQLHNVWDDFTFSLNNTNSSKRSSVKTVATIQNKSKELFKRLKESQSRRVTLIHLEHLVDYLKFHTFARQQVYRDGGIAQILKIKEKTACNVTIRQANLALRLLGYVDPVKGKGIRILALDGGETRGVMTIEMLKKIQEMCHQPIYELFDLIIGTSTGAILAFLIGVQKKSLSECRLLYEKLSTDIFNESQILGTGKLFLNHAYYDTANLEKIFKSEVGSEKTMIETAAENGPKVAAVSTVVNESILQPFVFRNYCFQPGHKNLYVGTSKHKVWEAIRASTAAPGYFEEFILEEKVHQDGGILINNPCALAIHEAKTLWPNTDIQAIISIGTGVYHGRTVPHTPHFSTLREKLSKLIASATDVEAVHITLQDLLPPDKYFRLNPNMSNDVPLDECRLDILKELEQDTRNYIEKFHHKYNDASLALRHRKSYIHRLKDKATLQSIMKSS